MDYSFLTSVMGLREPNMTTNWVVPTHTCGAHRDSWSGRFLRFTLHRARGQDNPAKDSRIGGSKTRPELPACYANCCCELCWNVVELPELPPRCSGRPVSLLSSPYFHTAFLLRISTSRVKFASEAFLCVFDTFFKEKIYYWCTVSASAEIQKLCCS